MVAIADETNKGTPRTLIDNLQKKTGGRAKGIINRGANSEKHMTEARNEKTLGGKRVQDREKT